MHPLFTAFMSTIVPPLLSLAPSIHAGYTLTPLHWSSCWFGWIVAWCFWTSSKKVVREARDDGRRSKLDAIEAYALRRLDDLGDASELPAQPAHEVNDRP